jgi:hypothetical protein
LSRLARRVDDMYLALSNSFDLANEAEEPPCRGI